MAEEILRYRVQVDDTDFQSRLTQYRSQVGNAMGTAMGGMMGGIGAATTGVSTALSDIGRMANPITFTSPAIAYEPHHGMLQIQQTFAQAGMSAMGVRSAPEGVTLQEWTAYSSRAFAQRFTDTLATTGIYAAGAGAEMATWGATGAAAAKYVGGGMLGGMAMGMPAAMAVGAAVETTAEAFRQSRQTEDYLGATSFRYMTGGKDVDPLTGRGFSTQARRRISGTMQEMDIKDPRYNMQDLMGIMQRGTELDLFQGTTGVQDFEKKFKTLTETLKVVTTTLHQSLNDGLETIKSLKEIGISSPQGITSSVMTADVLGYTAGRTGAEMLAIGRQGAELTRGMGIDMAIGQQSTQMNLANVRAMQNAGLISNDMVQRMGGEVSVAMGQTAQGIGFLQSGTGRGMMMGMMGGGGAFSAGGFGQMMNQQTPFGAFSQAVGHIRSPGDMMRFQINQEQIIEDMAKQIGPQASQLMQMQGAMMTGRMMGAQFGLNAEEQFKLGARNMGLGRDQTELMVSQLRDPEALRAQMMQGQESAFQKQAMEEMRNRYGYGMVTARIKDVMKAPFVRAGQAIDEAAGVVSDAIESTIYERVSGIRRGPNLNMKSGAAGMAAALAGGGDTSTLAGTVTDIDRFSLRKSEKQREMEDVVSSGERIGIEGYGEGAAKYVSATGRTVYDISDESERRRFMKEKGGNAIEYGSKVLMLDEDEKRRGANERFRVTKEMQDSKSAKAWVDHLDTTSGASTLKGMLDAGNLDDFVFAASGGKTRDFDTLRGSKEWSGVYRFVAEGQYGINKGVKEAILKANAGDSSFAGEALITAAENIQSNSLNLGRSLSKMLGGGKIGSEAEALAKSLNIGGLSIEQQLQAAKYLSAAEGAEGKDVMLKGLPPELQTALRAQSKGMSGDDRTAIGKLATGTATSLLSRNELDLSSRGVTEAKKLSRELQEHMSGGYTGEETAHILSQVTDESKAKAMGARLKGLAAKSPNGVLNAEQIINEVTATLGTAPSAAVTGNLPADVQRNMVAMMTEYQAQLNTFIGYLNTVGKQMQAQYPGGGPAPEAKNVSFGGSR